MDVATAHKTQRLHARLSPEQDRRLREAAAVLGVPMSQFAVDAADAAARQVLSDERLLRVPQEAADELFAWLDEPARVVPEMRRLVDARRFEQA
ncbi:MAG TPA: DUF1778 domain-containing protein [Nitriliruptorales bacterium]